MNISVIIPTLNEKAFIGHTLDRLFRNCESQVEVIVIDTGSADGTRDFLKNWPEVKVLYYPNLVGNKYAALNEGMQQSSSDILLFLDADTTLPFRFDGLIKQEIHRGAVGGAFRLKFDRSTISLELIRFFNEIRYRITKRYFGDQGIFCTRETFNLAGGFPIKPILAETELCAQIGKIGKLVLINEPVLTSSRRFFEGGIWSVFVKNLSIYLRDILGLPLTKSSCKYWSLNATTSPQLADK